MIKPMLALAAALTLALAGCAAPQAQESSAAAPVRQELTGWPDNDFTRLVPEPSAGEPDYALEDLPGGSYSIFLTGVTREEGEAYRDALLEAGFAQAAGASEEASGGWLLESPEAWVSVSCAEGALGIAITPREG